MKANCEFECVTSAAAPADEPSDFSEFFDSTAPPPAVAPFVSTFFFVVLFLDGGSVADLADGFEENKLGPKTMAKLWICMRFLEEFLATLKRRKFEDSFLTRKEGDLLEQVLEQMIQRIVVGTW